MQLDAFSMFEYMWPGTDGAVSGFIAVHAVAQALGSIREELSKQNKTVLFLLFQGVSTDNFSYILKFMIQTLHHKNFG